MSADQSNYLRRDLITLSVLLVIIAAVLFALWYGEQKSGMFTQAAKAWLDQVR